MTPAGGTMSDQRVTTPGVERVGVARSVRKLKRAVSPPLTERGPTRETISLIIATAAAQVALAELSVNTKSPISPDRRLPENRDWL
jgi:hypothetical protein